MITSSLGFYAFILAVMAIVLVLCQKYENTRLVKTIPAMVWIFLIIALCATFHVFDLESEGVIAAQDLMYSTFLPMMLIMFMLTCDVRQIIKLGPRMILAFLLATLSIMIGLTIAFLICKRFLPENAWAIIASASGAWMGETINMLAVASVFGVEGSDYAYAVMMVSIVTLVYIAVLLVLIPYTQRWNKMMKANTDDLDEIAERIRIEEDPDVNTCTMIDYCKIFAIGLCGSWAINVILPYMPSVTFLSDTGWRVVLACIIGIILGMTRVRKFHGAKECANVFLYACMCVTGSYCDLSECTSAPAFVLVVVIFLAVMFPVWALIGKLFKFDLFTSSVSLAANIGGTASAPLIASAHNTNWISFGVLLAFFGDIVGTGIAICFGYFLRFVSAL